MLIDVKALTPIGDYYIFILLYFHTTIPRLNITQLSFIQVPRLLLPLVWCNCMAICIV